MPFYYKKWHAEERKRKRKSSKWKEGQLAMEVDPDATLKSLVDPDEQKYLSLIVQDSEALRLYMGKNFEQNLLSVSINNHLEAIAVERNENISVDTGLNDKCTNSVFCHAEDDIALTNYITINSEVMLYNIPSEDLLTLDESNRFDEPIASFNMNSNTKKISADVVKLNNVSNENPRVSNGTFNSDLSDVILPETTFLGKEAKIKEAEEEFINNFNDLIQCNLIEKKKLLHEQLMIDTESAKLLNSEDFGKKKNQGDIIKKTSFSSIKRAFGHNKI
ncbi:hypothetical protein HK099_006289 [Clydaea vesicula]|uniref:Uncharacterized protein n=1 Tax=Clydaea vesicula TaxID=447962 RepID=A0AAD5U035_9FUNG|nr:hypothetical protein HK099_006289 [Clydaea vesicula]